ncbi:hypothetical protein ESZ50_11025 [Weissella muntiaci]|uniref:Uncharacterized protein n=1 Tax=Weissella muntiaci TaxID=2508881 RepID=A0A6C2C2G9_9LACO|nr:hypothetical protein [Weissella muntiaci]TYC47879.1 hypothetical protein ESZ50_11025 [Weissella muntiaci]
MKLLFDQTFPATKDDGASRHIWYEGVSLSSIGEYGPIVGLDANLKKEIVDLIYKDAMNSGEVLWYFYDEEVSEDTLDEQIRASLMIKKQVNGKFIVHFNFSDYNFATNLDKIRELRIDLEQLLNHVSFN